MISDNISLDSPQAKDAFPSIQPSHLALRVLETLEKWLPFFQKEYIQVPLSKKEDDISLELCSFLNEKSSFFIEFAPQKGVDFRIHVKPRIMWAKPFFVIEAKRLPTTHRKKEYVEGDRGGIERFKREQEGFDQSLPISAIVGYIQKHDFAHWFKEINLWIEALIKQNDTTMDIRWTEQDKLEKAPSHSEQLGRYISIHSRKTLQDIKLHHFWLMMYSPKATPNLSASPQ